MTTTIYGSIEDNIQVTISLNGWTYELWIIKHNNKYMFTRRKNDSSFEYLYPTGRFFESSHMQQHGSVYFDTLDQILEAFKNQ
jgi:hypothetical protein